MLRLFLSHSHGDHQLAGAVRRLVENCLPGHVEGKASSASPEDGGIPSGSDWFEWIREQVSTSRFTAVLLTPRSLDKPWLMWEAGAVAGVSMAKGEASTIIPIVYRLSMEQIPSPLRSRQAARGEDRRSLMAMLETVRRETAMNAPALEKLAEDSVPAYLKEVEQALEDTPPPLTDSAVQDWLDRITYFERTDRRSEIEQVHRAMVSVFAPGDNCFETPLDVRLHRRLGDIYLFAKNPEAAARQYKLALQLSPRDIFLLHKLGLALLERGDEPGAETMLNRLLAIDPGAARWSTEVAGLRGRLHWQRYQHSSIRNDLLVARDAYAEGLAANSRSHYMADNVGQLSLLLGEAQRARDAFEKGLEALDRTGDTGYWAQATRASCLLGLGRREEGLAALRAVAGLRPEPAALDSIRRGLVRLHKGLGADESELGLWVRVLSGA